MEMMSQNDKKTVTFFLHLLTDGILIGCVAAIFICFSVGRVWLGLGFLCLEVLFLTQHIRSLPGLTALLVMDNITSKKRPLSEGLSLQYLWESDVPDSETDIQALTHSFDVTVETAGGDPVTMKVSLTDLPSIPHLDRFRTFKTTEERRKGMDTQIEGYLTRQQHGWANREAVMVAVKDLAEQIYKETHDTRVPTAKEVRDGTFEYNPAQDSFYGLVLDKVSIDVSLPKDLSDAIIARESNRQKLEARRETTENQKTRVKSLIEASNGTLAYQAALDAVLMTDGGNVNKNVNKTEFALDIATTKALSEVLTNFRSIPNWNPEELSRLATLIEQMTSKVTELEAAVKGR